VRGERFPSRRSLLRQECGGGRPRRFDDPLIGPDQRPRYFRALCPRRPASPRPTATELPPPESPSRGSAPMVMPRRPPVSSNRHVRVNDTEPCSGSAPIPSPGRELPSTSGVRGHMVTGPRSVRRPVSEVEFQRGDAGSGEGQQLGRGGIASPTDCGAEYPAGKYIGRPVGGQIDHADADETYADGQNYAEQSDASTSRTPRNQKQSKSGRGRDCAIGRRHRIPADVYEC